MELLHKTTYRVLLSYASLLTIFYLTTIDTPQLLAVLVIAALVFMIDLYWLRKLLDGLSESLKTAKCVHSTLEAHFKNAFRIPGTYPLVRQEILVIFYSFFAKYYQPAKLDNTRFFGYQKASNCKDVFWLVAVAQLPTLPFIHFFIEHQGNAFAAWIVTTITLWSVLYFYAQRTAVQFLPIELTNDTLEYRYGMSWQASIPLSAIKSARIVGANDNPDYFDWFISPFGSDKNLIIEFYRPVAFKGLYFTRKRRKKAVLAVDNPNALLIELAKKNILTG